MDKTQASVVKHQWEGPQGSGKVFNSSLLLASGHNLRDLECLELNNNRLHSSEVSQVLVNSKTNHLGAYLEHNLLKQPLTSGKARVELGLSDSVSSQLDSRNSSSSNPCLGSNSSRHLSLANSNSKLPHSGSNLSSSLNHCLGRNLLNKPVLCLAGNLKGQVGASLEELQGLEALLVLQDSKSVQLALTSLEGPVYSVLSQLDKDSLEQQALLPQVSLAANYLAGLNNLSKAPSLEEQEVQALKNLSSVLNHLEHHNRKQANPSLEINLKDKASLEVLRQTRAAVFSEVRVLRSPRLEGNLCSVFLSQRRPMSDPLPHPL